MTSKIRARDRSAIAALFGIAPNTGTGRYLVLRRYVSSSPERFFNRTVHATYAAWLTTRHAQEANAFRAYLTDNLSEIERALLFLHEINVEEWHDEELPSSDQWEFLRFIDQRVHRTYLRLIEAVLTPLARIPAYFSRRDRGANTDGLDIFNIAQELASGPLASVTQSYRSIVRNGIGHGGIAYRQLEITYRDKRGNEETLTTNEIVRLCDDLLDDCNALAAAIALFYITHRDLQYPVPEELLVQELREETAAPWWVVDGAIRSQVPAGAQLLIYTRTRTHDFLKIQFSAIQSGVLAEAFAPGYERYFFSIRGTRSGTGWAAFHGDRLAAHRLASDHLDEYGDVLESIAFLPYKVMPKAIQKLGTIIDAFRINWPLGRREWHAARNIPEIVARTGRTHANGWRSVLRGSVVIPNAAPDQIRRHRKRIVQCAFDLGRADEWYARLLPLGFVQISVFAQDHRRRRLDGFGLAPDLVCTVRYQTIGRIRSPDIANSTVETRGPWRIAWNRAWLEREGVAIGPERGWVLLRPGRVL